MAATNPLLQRFIEIELRPYRYRPVEFARRILDIDPHLGQQTWLLNSVLRNNALTTGNQFGKSFGAAIKLIWRATYEKGWTPAIRAAAEKGRSNWEAMNIGPSADQANLVYDKAREILRASRRGSWLVRDDVRSPFSKMTLVNDALIQARTTDNDGRKLQGHTLDFVNWDEAALEKRFLEIRDGTLKMRLAVRRGMLDFTTTGNGRNDYGKYFLTGLPGDDKDPQLYSQRGSSFENPYADLQSMQETSAGYSEYRRRQHINGEIVDAGGLFFSIEDLEKAEDPDLTFGLVTLKKDSQDQIRHAAVFCDRNESGLTPDEGNGAAWIDRFPTHRYVHFWDLARKKDFVVGITIDTSGKVLKLIEFERFNQMDWSYVYDRIRARHHRYRPMGTDGPTAQSKTYLDLTGVGDVVADGVKDIRPEGLMFSARSKDEILSGLQSALSMREIKYPMIPIMYDELKFYERDDKSLVQDTVMALAGAVHFSRRRRFSGSAVV